jgi:hypothetical protein
MRPWLRFPDRIAARPIAASQQIRPGRGVPMTATDHRAGKIGIGRRQQHGRPSALAISDNDRFGRIGMPAPDLTHGLGVGPAAPPPVPSRPPGVVRLGCRQPLDLVPQQNGAQRERLERTAIQGHVTKRGRWRTTGPSLGRKRPRKAANGPSKPSLCRSAKFTSSFAAVQEKNTSSPPEFEKTPNFCQL